MGINRLKQIPMSLIYLKIKKHPQTFLRLFGISPVQFEKIMTKLHPLWKKRVIARYKRPGRDFKRSLEDMVLMLLLYYRCYITHEFIGFLFNIDPSRVCRLIKRLEPLLATIMAIPKVKVLSQQEAESLILDVTEQPIERPKKGQKAYYSGKKKRHTIKTEVRITANKRIVHVSKCRPGSVHDFNLHKTEPPVPDGTTAYADSGYQGLDKLHPNSEIPYKSSKNNPLNEEQKEYNAGLSSFRVRGEHVFASMKTFRILSDRYRNKRKRYHVKVNIIAGIVNMKNGFAFA
jgi:IS5 family transposase